MADAGINAFTNWLNKHDILSRKVRPFLTIAVLLSDDERLMRIIQDGSADTVDQELLEELLSFADPSETVQLLTQRVGAYLSPQTFKRVFDRTLAATDDLNTISGLVYVAGLFLERNPGAFQLPRDLVNQLLNSDDLDQRIGGLKACRHCMASSTEVFTHFIHALKRNVWEDKWLALSQLRQMLVEGGSQLAEATERITLEELRTTLHQVAQTDPEIEAVVAAERCVSLLEEERVRKQSGAEQ